MYLFLNTKRNPDIINIVKKRFPSKPFEFGKYIVEYREETGVLRFLKERLDNLDAAELAREKLITKGYNDLEIKKVG